MLTVCPQTTDVMHCKIAEQHLPGTTRDHDLCGGMWIKQAMCVKTLYPCLSNPRLPFKPNRQPGASEGLFYVFVEIEKELGSKENIHTLDLLPHSNLPVISVLEHTSLSPALFSFLIVSHCPIYLSYFISPLSLCPYGPSSPLPSGCAATPHPRC